MARSPGARIRAASSALLANGKVEQFASRFRDGLIAEERVITDLAERLLLARKR
jgi:hypothetical protein